MRHLGQVAGPPGPVISVRPVVLPAPGRGEDLRLRVSAPAAGGEPPVWAYLRGALSPADPSRPAASAELADGADPLGRIDSK